MKEREYFDKILDDVHALVSEPKNFQRKKHLISNITAPQTPTSQHNYISGLLLLKLPTNELREALGKDDVSLKITHCGICYADAVMSKNKYGDSRYPLVPGHEIAGIVKEVGSCVSNFKVGDHVGVGTYVNSCRECEHCNDRDEVSCEKGAIFTFNGIDTDGSITKGGYSSHIVVHESYCFRIPDGYPLASAAPLLCAGITVYNPMMRHKMNQPGKSLGVIGLGGLGHMAVKFGKAFGLKVTVLSTSISKKEEALCVLGADNFVITSDQEQMKALHRSLDFIIDTASGDHPFDPFMSLLKTAGVFVLVGFPSEVKFHPASLNIGMKTISVLKDQSQSLHLNVVKWYLENLA
ncbi:hypothetical protein OIU76_025759 [Salix suchowensis]|nr:hypothetical protein OIU76_025759 [Salix suchowensis]